MSVDLHTIALKDASSALAQPDRLGSLICKVLAFAASASSLTALGSLTAGTGYTAIPSVAVTGTAAGAIVVVTSLKAVSAAIASGGGGSGFADSGDTITFANGVVLNVTASGGVITALAIGTAGAVTSVPVGPQKPTATSGAGVLTSVAVNIAYGIGAAQIINSGTCSGTIGFTVTPSDGNGTGAAIANGTLGGNGAAIFVGVLDKGLAAANSAVFGTPSVAAFVSRPAQPLGAAVVALTPILAASTLAAGTCDLLVFQ